MRRQTYKKAEGDDAYSAIMDAIVTQQLAPSQKVSENILSDMFGISRTVARNLIERLIAQHFLVSISPRVTQVAPLTALEIKQNFALRKVFLPSIWTQAAAYVDYDELDRRNAEIEAMHPIDSDDTALNILKKNKELNMMVCEKTGYPLMLDWAGQLEDTAMRIYWLYIKANDSSPYSSAQQGMIFDIMRGYEPARIKMAVHDTLSQIEDRVLNTIFSSKQFYTRDLKV
ncbi:GntR family transcriptional regulator [Parahaliea aestuarii]|uniref:GntR family transcriptional regulator n=1 Tax=Parahaliea aestuarii TaxID=1852021 RepID=A0A5C8ZMG2_9GAMM|nr:GntR family transcriptional regulator [Parahaliea aestuarii]TXS89375.1 GntR family transcriptional regulator [Parahaliea aestuarii]